MLNAFATPLAKFCTSRHSVSFILEETGRTKARSVASWQAEMKEKNIKISLPLQHKADLRKNYIQK